MQPVSPQNHTDKFWQKFTNYRFAARTQTAAVVVAEIGQAVRTLPLAFIKQGDNYVLAAVMSLSKGQNLYVAQDGRWLGGYVPAAFRGYPFSLRGEQLYIDESSGLISDTDGEVLYDKNGELSKPVQDVLNFLQQIEQNRTVTDLAVAALQEAGCIAEWRLKDTKVTGLYRTDEAGLNSLNDQAFLKLRKAGGLPIAYAQLFSMANIGVFDNLIKIREQMKEPEIDKGFLNDDMISFE